MIFLCRFLAKKLPSDLTKLNNHPKIEAKDIKSDNNKY